MQAAAQTRRLSWLDVMKLLCILAVYCDHSNAGDSYQALFAYVNGAKVEGTMPNNGAISATIDGLTTTSYAVPAGYTSGGTVSLTNDIETALAAI